MVSLNLICYFNIDENTLCYMEHNLNHTIPYTSVYS